MAQKLVLSPQQHAIDTAPEYSFLTAASISGSLDIVSLHLGHVIWFPIIFLFTRKDLPGIEGQGVLFYLLAPIGQRLSFSYTLTGRLPITGVDRKTMFPTGLLIDDLVVGLVFLVSFGLPFFLHGP